MADIMAEDIMAVTDKQHSFQSLAYLRQGIF